jgi:hypothetical protein
MFCHKTYNLVVSGSSDHCATPPEQFCCDTRLVNGQSFIVKQHTKMYLIIDNVTIIPQKQHISFVHEFWLKLIDQIVCRRKRWPTWGTSNRGKCCIYKLSRLPKCRPLKCRPVSLRQAVGLGFATWAIILSLLINSSFWWCTYLRCNKEYYQIHK